MIFRRWLILVPFSLTVACSDETATSTNGADPDSARDRANGHGDNSGTGVDIQTRGASLFRGAGLSGAGEPLGPEIPPSTAHDCVPVGTSAANPGAGPAEMTCFFDEADEDLLSATIERRLEIVNDERWIHLRLTFNPDFVDNSYGETAIGWGDDATPEAAEPPTPDGKRKPKAKKGKGSHTFKDLVGSDHAEFQLFDTNGALKVHFKLDYIEPSNDTDSGYACAGVTGGDGKMIVGDADWVMGATSSLDRNLNGCGWGDYIVDSPATDDAYTPNPEAPTWDYRVVYEVWVAEEPFGVDGFGDARIEYVHASPSKADGNTLIVVPGPCPTPTDVPQPDAGFPPDPTPPPPATSTPAEPATPDAGTDAGRDDGQPSLVR